MKKLTCFLLITVITLVLFAGCTETTPTVGGVATTAPETTSENNVPEQTQETTSPVDDRITLVIGIGDVGNNPDLKNSEFTKYLEEKTGYNLEFRVIDGKTTTYGSLFYAAKKDISCLPDIFIDVSADPDLYDLYTSRAIFANLAAYFDDPVKSSNFWTQVEAVRNDTNGHWNRLVDQMVQTMYTKDAAGNKAVYGVPSVDTSLIKSMAFMPFINQKWLDAVGMNAPTDPYELQAVLRAFRDKDPNGNQLQDEIPMMGYMTNTSGNDLLTWLINFFVYTNEDATLNLQNGQLSLAEAEGTYRNALIFLRELVAEGLLAPQTLSYKAANLKFLLSDADQIGLVVGDPKAMFANETVAARFVPLNMFGHAYFEQESVRYNTFITANCKNLDAAWELLMCLYTEEAALFQSYGIQGEGWEYADGSVTTEFGMPAVIKVLKKPSQITSAEVWKGVKATISTYKISELTDNPNLSGKELAIKKHYGDQYQNYKVACDWTLCEYADMICPVLDYGDDTKEMTRIRSELQDVIKRWRSFFITGEYSVSDDREWDTYLQKLNTAKLQEYLAIAQQTYDQMYPNGHK